jgi:poly(A) polymerase
VKVQGAWLDHPGTQSLCRALEGAGYQALFVGGCVRNALLGVAVKDVDMATDATPQTVTNIAQNAGFKVIPTGIDHGTVTVIAEGVPHEVTTFRQDISTDGRHAIVAFSTDVAQDAMRRDFTMNALYARADGGVVDPLRGLPDLLARRVMFVGDPNQRIAEDYLRILRFFRFFAWYGDHDQGLDADGLAACAENLAGIETLSRERVGAEMCKLLAAADPSQAVAAMAQSGVLTASLPGANATALPVAVHFGLQTWQARLAVLGGAIDTLRLSRADVALITLMRDEFGSMRGPGELAYRHGMQTAAAIVLGRAAMFEIPPAPDWRAQAERGAQAVFPVTSADLMPVLQGPALGAALRDAQNRWIASNFALTKSDLLG